MQNTNYRRDVVAIGEAPAGATLFETAGFETTGFETAGFETAGLEDVERLMAELVGRADRCGAMAAEHLATGGKRLRARLALAATEALGGDPGHAIGWAAACELLHNATLIHDDLQDQDPVRRGRPTVWATHGPAQAINAGDLMLMLPVLALEAVPAGADLRWRLARGLAEHAAETARGQADEMSLLPSRRLTWEAYRRAAERKTSALLTLPVFGAAVLSGRDDREARLLAAEFTPLGLLFQMQDDALDLFGDKGRDDAGSDVREGKVSALVVEHLRLHPEDTPWLVRILEKPRAETTDLDVAAVRRRFREGGALARVLERISHLARATAESPRLRAERELGHLVRDLLARLVTPISSPAESTARGGAR